MTTGRNWGEGAVGRQGDGDAWFSDEDPHEQEMSQDKENPCT
jgi:hypothetical protein